MHQQHPLSKLIPPMSPEERHVLALSISDNGLLNPIVMYEGKVLDGWSRQSACQSVNVEPRYVDYEGTEPAAYVLAANVHRRSLTPLQRLQIAESMRPLLEAESRQRKSIGEDVHADNCPHAENNGDLPENDKAGAVNSAIGAAARVSGKTAARYHAIQETGTDDLIAAVNAEQVAISDAAAICTLHSDVQDKAVQLVLSGEKPTLREAVKDLLPLNDHMNNQITDLKMQEVFSACSLFREANDLFHRLASVLDAIASCKGGTDVYHLMKHRNSGHVHAGLETIRESVFQAEPYLAVCPDCAISKCQTCMGRKWLTRSLWKKYRSKQKKKT